MADQYSNFPGSNDDIIAAISSAEQLLMSDEIPDDPLLNSLANNMMQAHHSYDGNHGTHFSGISFDENICINNNENNNFMDLPLNSNFGNPIQIPIWPPPPSPYSCTCCQTLRQIFHTNGTNVLKLDIHGRLGLISHAILDRYNTDTPSENHEYQMFDFCQESMLSVKQFLVQYCDDRKREGYIMLHDPLSNFYNALCIGFYSDVGNFDDDIFLHETPREEMHVNQEEEGNNVVRVTKSNIASQRERTGRMKLKDVAGYFHLPINVASKQLKICASALKGICRKGGLSRWPHRKIKSIKSSISKKKQSLNSNDANERARASIEIQQLQTELANIYQGNGGMVNSPSHE
ncbi:hypothetical protein ABFX02_01G008700 [Erythranthe guttata]